MTGLPADAANDLAARRAARKQRQLIEAPPGVTASPIAHPDDLAPHPDNPRKDLGDLTELGQSMRSLGILEPLVVTTRDAHLAAHPDHGPALGSARYVIVAGHRRLAAARKIGLAELPIVVKPELSQDGRDYESMVVENVHRADLTALEEANSYQRLVQMGRSQRDIAERVGRTQSHVSKRLALLRLPESIRVAIQGDQLPVIDALTLGKLDTAEHQAAAWELMTAHGLNAAQAVARQRERAALATRTEASRAQAAAEGVLLIEVGDRWGTAEALKRRLHDVDAIAGARSTGNLVAAIDTDGSLAYFTTAEPSPPNVAGHSDDGVPAAGRRGKQGRTSRNVPTQTGEAAEDHLRQAAAKEREAACARITGRKPAAPDALRRLATSVITLGVDTADLTMAHHWLREAGVGPDVPDPCSYAVALQGSGDTDAMIRLAFAMALAADERHTRRPGPWDARAVAHVRRLMADAQHAPTHWEQRRLVAAEVIPLESPREDGAADRK